MSYKYISINVKLGDENTLYFKTEEGKFTDFENIILDVQNLYITGSAISIMIVLDKLPYYVTNLFLNFSSDDLSTDQALFKNSEFTKLMKSDQMNIEIPDNIEKCFIKYESIDYVMNIEHHDSTKIYYQENKDFFGNFNGVNRRRCYDFSTEMSDQFPNLELFDVYLRNESMLAITNPLIDDFILISEINSDILANIYKWLESSSKRGVLKSSELVLEDTTVEVVRSIICTDKLALKQVNDDVVVTIA